MMITKKMIKEATKGLLKNGFKGEIKIFTGKRSFGKVSNLTELRARLYELASTKSYKSYSIDFGEGLIEVLNFKEEKKVDKVEKVEVKDEKIEEVVETKETNYTLYVGQRKIDMVAEDSFDAIVVALEELETIKGHDYAMNISKGMDLDFYEKQLEAGAVTIASDIWIKNLNARGYKKVETEPKLNAMQIANRKKALCKKTVIRKTENTVEPKKTKISSPSNSTIIVNSFINSIDPNQLKRMDFLKSNLVDDVKMHILAFEIANGVKVRNKSKKVIFDRIIKKLHSIVIANVYAA